MTRQPKRRRFNLALALPLGGMILLGITTSILGFVLWPDPPAYEDTSTEGWPEHGPQWLTSPRSAAPPSPATAPPAPGNPDAGSPAQPDAIEPHRAAQP